MARAATTSASFSATGERIAPVPDEQPLTDEQLQLGFRQLRRPGWPDTLEQAMAHPAKAAAIKGMARQLGRAAFGRSVPQPAARPAPPPVTAAAAPAPAPLEVFPTAATPAPAPQPKPRKPRTANQAAASIGSWPFASRKHQPGRDLKRAAANDHDDDDEEGSHAA